MDGDEFERRATRKREMREKRVTKKLDFFLSISDYLSSSSSSFVTLFFPVTFSSASSSFPSDRREIIFFSFFFSPIIYLLVVTKAGFNVCVYSISMVQNVGWFDRGRGGKGKKLFDMTWLLSVWMTDSLSGDVASTAKHVWTWSWLCVWTKMDPEVNKNGSDPI